MYRSLLVQVYLVAIFLTSTTLFALSKNVASTTTIAAVLIISFMLLVVVGPGVVVVAAAASAVVVVVVGPVVPVAALAGLMFCICPVMFN